MRKEFCEAASPQGRASGHERVNFLSNGGITCHAGRMVKVDKLGAKKE